MRILSSLFGSLFLLVAICFTVTNRQTAVVSLWPFDAQIEAPIYLLTLGCLVCGFLLGSVVTWISLIPHRLATRRLHKEVMRLHDKIGTLQESVQSSASLVPAPAFKTRRNWRFWDKST